jgi:hypothetical protein
MFITKRKRDERLKKQQASRVKELYMSYHDHCKSLFKNMQSDMHWERDIYLLWYHDACKDEMRERQKRIMMQQKVTLIANYIRMNIKTIKVLSTRTLGDDVILVFLS